VYGGQWGGGGMRRGSEVWGVGEGGGFVGEVGHELEEG